MRKYVGNHARRHTASNRLVRTVGAVVSLSLLYSIFLTSIPARADGESVTTNQSSYQMGDTILISGSGWPASSGVEIVVDDDSGDPWITTATANTDEAGSFSDHPVTLPPSVSGGFTVSAGGGAATTTFTVEAPPPPPPASAPTISAAAATYRPGDTVQISGTDWGGSSLVHIDISTASGSVHGADVSAEADGSVSDSWVVPDGFEGNATVTASGVDADGAGAQATDGFTVLGTPTITSDKPDYAPGETVTLTGSGWAPDLSVHIVVDDNLNRTWQHTADVPADAQGGFVYSFSLPTHFVAQYTVVASQVLEDGTVLEATTTFTDLSIGTYDQCSNDDGDGYATGDLGCRWINGNLQSNNSKYFEGDATVQRLWLTGFVPNSVHSVTLKYGTTKGGKHAYDFLTTWDWSEDWVLLADRCQGITGCTTTAEDSLDIPEDPNVPPSFEPSAPGDRQFVMRGGDMTSATTPAIASGTYAGDSETVITISFTVGSSGPMCPTTGPDAGTCSVALWFGAHVAAQADWGAGTGAGNISGSPYHVALDAVDGSSVGQRDNQMQANTVVPNGTIVIVKDAIPDDAQDFDFNLTNGTTVNQNFSLDDDTDVTLPNSQSFSVPPGSYTAVESAPPAPWTLTNLVCSDPTNNSTVNVGTRTATIDLASAETVTCTYTNSASTAPTLVTEIHNGSDHSTGVLSVALGSTVHDQATVSGGFGTPTGTVIFKFWNNGTCNGDPVATSGTFALSGGVADGTTFTQGPLGAGSYSFQAHYNGGGPYTAADSPCEPLTVTKAQLTVDTKVHDSSHADVTNSSVPLGSVVHDTATMSGGVSGFTTPAITFTFYANGDCTGDGTAVANTGADEVDTAAVRSAASAALGAGSYSYKGSVAGDDNYLGDNSDCEPFTVGGAEPTVTTEIHKGADHDTDVQNTTIDLGSSIHDEVTVTGNGTIDPTGTADFTFFSNGTCDPGEDGENVLDTDSDVALVSGVAESSTQANLGAGTYSFLAHYDGDSNYDAKDAACETVTVGTADLTVTTEVHDPEENDITSTVVAAGTEVHDSASISGGVTGFPVDGTLTYSFYTNSTCTGDPDSTEDVTVSDGSVPESSSQTISQPGGYCYQATFVPDGSDYNGDTSPIEPFSVIQKSLVTNTELCTFDVDSSTSGDQFRLIYTPETGATFKLNASNPGQFYYNVFDNFPTEEMTITLPYPWVTQGATAIHVYDSVETTTVNGETCLTPGDEVALSHQTITLGSYTDTNGDGSIGFGDTASITINYDLPDSGFVYVNIHVDYGLKDATGCVKAGLDSKDANCAVPDITIPNLQSYTFSVENGITDSQTVSSVNVFKKDPGVAGFVWQGGSPVVDTRVRIVVNGKTSTAQIVRTDEDGWYLWAYKYSGKPATFTVTLLDLPGQPTQSATLRSNSFVRVDFFLP